VPLTAEDRRQLPKYKTGKVREINRRGEPDQTVFHALHTMQNSRYFRSLPVFEGQLPVGAIYEESDSEPWRCKVKNPAQDGDPRK